MKTDRRGQASAAGNTLARVANRQRRVPVDSARVRQVAEFILDKMERVGAEVSVVLVSDKRIRKLNRDYLGRDRPTDVLAFSQQEGEGGDLHPHLLGDVIISTETALLQARSEGIPFDRELDLLLVHGILHLLGYDHVGSVKERKLMEARQKSLMKGIQELLPEHKKPGRRVP